MKKFEIKTNNGTYDVNVYMNGEHFKPLYNIGSMVRPFIKPKFKGKMFAKIMKRGYDENTEPAGMLLDSKWKVGNNSEYDEIFSHLKNNNIIR